MFDIEKLAQLTRFQRNSVRPTAEDILGDPQYAEFLAFTTREEYVAWREEWKAAYTDLSGQIRTMRKEWRAEGQNHAFPLHGQLFRARCLARTMLAIRHASRIRAEAEYQSSRAVAVSE